MSSSYILSDNGVSSGSAGLKSSAGNDGTLLLQTATSSGTATTAVTIDNAQNVGVGTSTPNIYSSGAYKYLTVSNSAASGYSFATLSGGAGGGGELDFGNQTIKHGAIASLDGSALGFYTNGTNTGTSVTERARIDSSGRLLVGTTSSIAADAILQVNTGKFLINSTNSSFGQFQIGNANSNGEASIQFISNVATFGATPTSTSGDNYCWNIGAGNYSIGGNSFGIANKGNAGINVKLAYNSSSWISVSDERIKDIQSDITNAYEIVKDWRTVYYTLKSDPLKITKIGLLAQDVQKTLPAAVDIPETETDDKGKLNPWGVHYTDVIPVLVKAIQEQQALIQSLTDRLTALEGAAK